MKEKRERRVHEGAVDARMMVDGNGCGMVALGGGGEAVSGGELRGLRISVGVNTRTVQWTGVRSAFSVLFLYCSIRPCLVHRVYGV